METTQQIIERIITDFNVGEGGTLFPTKNLIASLDDKNTNQHVELISNILYKNFYSSISDSKKSNIIISAEQQEEFCGKLVYAYNPAPAFSKGWAMIEKENNGVAYLQKKGTIIKANPGQFVFEYDEIDNSYNPSLYLSVLIPPIVNNKKNYFYYISGSTPDSGNESPIVRFYFNQQPKGSPELIKQITNYFNLHQVPFTFKCCQNIADYNRTDSAVLYVAYNYFAISIQLLEKIIAQVKQFLNKEVPLFSLQLTDGFSFAENPFENLSFGQSRCNIIAVGICNCVTKKIKKENWADSILEKLIEEGLNPEKMYLNPSSVYNYNFALANFK